MNAPLLTTSSNPLQQEPAMLQLREVRGYVSACGISGDDCLDVEKLEWKLRSYFYGLIISVVKRIQQDPPIPDIQGGGGYGCVVNTSLFGVSYWAKMVCEMGQRPINKEDCARCSELAVEEALRNGIVRNIPGKAVDRGVGLLQIEGTRFWVAVVLVDYFPDGALVSQENISHVLKYPFSGKVRVLREMAQAIWYLHTAGWIHRDIKLSNYVIVRGLGQILAIDFYSVCEADAPEKTRLVGTPAFEAPETNSFHYGKAVDIFSLGMAYYQLLSGGKLIHHHKLNQGLHIEAAMNFQKRKDCVRFPSFDVLYGDLWSLILNMCHFDEKQRPTIQHVSKTLCDIVERGEIIERSDNVVQVANPRIMANAPPEKIKQQEAGAAQKMQHGTKEEEAQAAENFIRQIQRAEDGAQLSMVQVNLLRVLIKFSAPLPAGFLESLRVKNCEVQRPGCCGKFVTNSESTPRLNRACLDSFKNALAISNVSNIIIVDVVGRSRRSCSSNMCLKAAKGRHREVVDQAVPPVANPPASTPATQAGPEKAPVLPVRTVAKPPGKPTAKIARKV